MLWLSGISDGMVEWNSGMEYWNALFTNPPPRPPPLLGATVPPRKDGHGQEEARGGGGCKGDQSEFPDKILRTENTQDHPTICCIPLIPSCYLVPCSITLVITHPHPLHGCRKMIATGRARGQIPLYCYM